MDRGTATQPVNPNPDRKKVFAASFKKQRLAVVVLF
jgi:hypothetical protein